MSKLQEMHSKGVSMSACNKYGESIIHLAARKGFEKIFKLLFHFAETIYICDDKGRTVLHDACWSATPNFSIVTSILDRDSSLFNITDSRGYTSLAYVKQNQWSEWMRFFDLIKDRYWPKLQEN